jgi:anti-sigma-K factor RskA
MHQPIQDNLEDFLSGNLSEERRMAFERQLEQNREDRAAVDVMARQAAMLRALKVEAEPSPGFYARVMERIESQRPISFWSMFLEPVFAKRLALAALALFVVLTGVALTTPTENENSYAALPDHVLVLPDDTATQPRTMDMDHDRGVVLATVGSWDDNQRVGVLLTSAE